MARLAIVSSYNEECGAAFYSYRLKKHLEAAGFEVDVKRLPVSLLRISSPVTVRQKGDREIDRIAKEISEYDAVLLQFEPGLYGVRPVHSYSRVAKLLAAAKRAVVTVHGFHRGVGHNSILSSTAALTRSLARGHLKDAYTEVAGSGLATQVSKFWTYVAGAKNVRVMTFCNADKVLLERFFDIKNIVSYPITYFDQAEVDQIRSSVNRTEFLTQFGLDPAKKYFGVFGFLSPYKGHLTAIKALEYLPDDWNLAIVGGEHPQAIEAERDIGGYLRQLLAFSLEGERETGSLPASVPFSNSAAGDTMVRGDLDRIQLQEEILKKSEFKHFLPGKSIRHRIKFLGQVSDDEMPKFYAALDCAVHPYMKTKSGQSGSGPATLALEFGIPSLFSNVPVFREMSQFFENSMSFFNVGNFIELAEALERQSSFAPTLSAARNAALTKYNPAGMVDAYRQCIES